MNNIEMKGSLNPELEGKKEKKEEVNSASVSESNFSDESSFKSYKPRKREIKASNKTG